LQIEEAWTASLGRNCRQRAQVEKSGWVHDIDEVGSGMSGDLPFSAPEWH